MQSMMLTQITREPEKLLTPEQDLELTRAAYLRSRSPMMRPRLASMLLLQEGFEEIISLFEADETPSYWENLCLATAYLARQDVEGSRQADAAARAAFDLASSDLERAEALAYRGKAEMRMARTEQAFRTFNEALRLDPKNKDACKRLAALHFEQDTSQELLHITTDLHGKGANHARLFAAKSLAEARSGDQESAQDTVGLGQFLFERMLEPPTGWDSVDAFNNGLAEELLNHPCLRYERYGSASELTWRVESPLRPDAPALRALVEHLETQLHDMVRQIAASDHPWARALPPQSYLRCWSVITESTGFENWHVHQFGWLSGVYYVRVPDSISKGGEKGGCLAFGLPEDLAGEEGSAQFGQTLVRPQEGLMLAFPSHTYHRTFPHGTGEKRICFAFDLRPL